MKKIIILSITLFCCAVFVKAQNTSPYWSIAGNNNATAASKLGTTNDISLRFYTNNVQRMIVNSTAGYVGIGIPAPVNILTVRSSGGTPAASWLNGLNSPVFMGFAESVSSEFVLADASNTPGRRAVIQGRRSRGTLASPSAVVNNDYLASFLASGYDGSAFQNPASIDFYVDSTPYPGHVNARISFVTGTNIDDRVERLKVGSTGNFNFNNDQLYIRKSDGKIGVGTTSPSAQLHVIAGSGNGIYSSGSYIGVQAFGRDGFYGIGVQGTGADVGVYGIAGDGDGFGTFGESYSGQGAAGASTYGFGVRGYSEQGTGASGQSGFGTGFYGYSEQGTGGNFESVTGRAITASTMYGDYAGVFNGAVYASGGFITSDKNLKKNIHEFDNAMQIISKLKPLNYEFKNDSKYASLHLPGGSHYGLMAQDLEKILPNLVSEGAHELRKINPAATDKTTAPGRPSMPVAEKREVLETIKIKAVDYIELIPIMIKAMQEQEARIEALTKLVNALAKNNDQRDNLNLSAASLSNTFPNPAGKSTRISYTIPPAFNKAEIIISNASGQKIKQMELNKSGSINIDTSRLNAGTYSYTLVVDGITVNTKKMIITK